jgi:hypothetical protein
MAPNAGTYDLVFQAEGYEEKTLTDIDLLAGAITTLEEDPVMLVPAGLATPPNAQLTGATPIGESRLTLTGIVNAMGSATNARFRIGTAPGVLTDIGTIFQATGNVDLDVQAQINNLDCETTYYYQLSAENAGGPVLSAEQSDDTGICGADGVIFLDGFE